MRKFDKILINEQSGSTIGVLYANILSLFPQYFGLPPANPSSGPPYPDNTVPPSALRIFDYDGDGQVTFSDMQIFLSIHGYGEDVGADGYDVSDQIPPEYLEGLPEGSVIIGVPAYWYQYVNGITPYWAGQNLVGEEPMSEKELLIQLQQDAKASAKIPTLPLSGDGAGNVASKSKVSTLTPKGKNEMAYYGKDLLEAVMHQISEDAQPFENLVEQKRKFDARDHSSRVNVTFVADADQRSYENITRDPALKKLPGFLGLGRTIFHSRKGKAEFTFRAANNVSKVGMNEKDEGKFKKLLKKHGLKLIDTIYEGSKKLDEAIAARDIQGMIKGLNKKAKQEIAGVLNDMNLSGYGDYEARADNVHKFKPKDLLKAMNKVMKLEEKKLPTARKIVSGLGDADGPFTVVVMKNNKVIHQESTKFAKMLPAIVKELAKEMPNTTIGIENRTGQLVKVFK